MLGSNRFHRVAGGSRPSRSVSSGQVDWNDSVPRIGAFLVYVLALTVFTGVCSHPAEGAGVRASIHYDLTVSLEPPRHRLTVKAKITVLGDYRPELHFLLHKGLDPVSLTQGVRVVREGAQSGAVPVESFKVILPKGLRTFEIRYGGEIHHALESHETELERGFRQTPGLISSEGIYLGGESYWYPRFDLGTVTFNLVATLPRTWDLVSQGERTLHKVECRDKRVTWESPEPQEGIFLIAAKFTEYVRTSDRVTAMVFLRTPDEELAKRYLSATERYVALYEKLIGPYPYKKFAAVENFWETGFGMPSFTLLGPKVIRFPFILHSSFPHEILHNWWGNGVFPDYESGNWSEGLTSYLADHLIKEQAGQGAEYRGDTLQKYADYVSGEKDFPISRFRSRHSPSTAAVGYGKTLMFFHMLRQRLGDRDFVQGLKHFFKEYKFRTARFDDVRKSFESVSGIDLKKEFEQWVTRAGAPALKIRNAAYEPEPDGYVVSLSLEQTQPDDAYLLRIPIAVTLEGREHAYESVLVMTEKLQEWRVNVPRRPLRVDVDPAFDLFRKLDRNELPPALSQFFGAKSAALILPSSGSERLLSAYQDLAKSWSKSGPATVQVVIDKNLDMFPSDEAVVIFGWENKFLGKIASALSEHGATLNDERLEVGDIDMPRGSQSVATAIGHPHNAKRVLVLVASENPDALPGLGRKLPHYNKYGYLGFAGNEPINTIKGRWKVSHSPMTTIFSKDGRPTSGVKMGKLAPRKPPVALTRRNERARSAPAP
jgi:Peptidase family M1 domain